jgi:hypothetical protein
LILLTMETSISMDKETFVLPGGEFMRRPLGRTGRVLLIAAITTAPAVLFFDPAPLWPGQRHVPREPMEIYTLFSDDVAYVGSSRTWVRTVSNLFVPHNTHIVPAWRILTWALTGWAGNLERIPRVFAIASYSILLAVMVLIGRLVARETGRTGMGMAAMILMGTTSLMLTPATWYSAGQTLWAGFAIMATLWYAQQFRRAGRMPALIFAMISAMLAGWFWTVGHLAGSVAAVYLWADGRRRCRNAAAAPLAASAIAVALSLAIASSRIDSKIGFHGRTVREAIRPARGLLHMSQAIPENLVFGNIGLAVQTTQAQGAILTLLILGASLSRLWLGRRAAGQGDGPTHERGAANQRRWALSPLECAGAALVVGSYLVEWAFRGYMEYRYLRTINMRFIVPWYHVIPQIGAVLWLAGWWSEMRPASTQPHGATKTIPLTRWGGLGLVLLIGTLMLLNRPRVDFLVRQSVPPLLPSEQKRWPLARLQMMRANIVLQSRSDWQRATLRRLDRAQELTSRLGLGRDAIRSAFGHPYLPGSVGALRPELYDLYDTVALLDLPEHARPAIPIAVRDELIKLFGEVKEPRPEWLTPDEVWPPQGETGDGQ